MENNQKASKQVARQRAGDNGGKARAKPPRAGVADQAARPRRTQEDRSAGTRACLFEATVHLLNTRGYAATTTTAVCHEAKVSRGAMLHHFPTRIDLMLYVVRAVYEEEIALYHQALDTVDDPDERTLMMPDLLWQVLGRPAGVAALEIMQGSRSDPVLSTRLTALQADIERDSFKQTNELLGIAGVSEDAIRLLVWSIRGLSVARLLSPDPRRISGSVDMLQRMLKAALEAGVFHDAGSAAK